MGELSYIYELRYKDPVRFRAEKSNIINIFLEKIKRKGFECKLNNFDNAHITARSKSGKIMSFYALTGTIVGYGGSDYVGVDCFIDLLERC